MDAATRSWDLHQACAHAMSARGISAKRLKPMVANLIRDLTAQVQPAGALAALARLKCFDLIVCLTPDDLLARALVAAQPGLALEIASYSPTAPSNQSVDIGAPRPDVLRLCHPLSSLAAVGDFAIHEEDTLEYLHRLYDQGERRVKTLLTELRGKDRIFLGTSLPDWLARGLMRFVNDQRLATEERTMEFLSTADADPALSDFIARFSNNSIVLPWAPVSPWYWAIIGEWRERSPFSSSAVEMVSFMEPSILGEGARGTRRAKLATRAPGRSPESAPCPGAGQGVGQGVGQAQDAIATRWAQAGFARLHEPLCMLFHLRCDCFWQNSCKRPRQRLGGFKAAFD